MALDFKGSLLATEIQVSLEGLALVGSEVRGCGARGACEGPSAMRQRVRPAGASYCALAALAVKWGNESTYYGYCSVKGE